MEQLLATKFFIPSPRKEVVLRSRLVKYLDDNLQAGAKLIILSAPAGFGKTTLLTEWISNSGPAAGNGHPHVKFAWLSLDGSDNDHSRFLAYFIQAFYQIEGEELRIGQDALTMLQSPQVPPSDVVLTSLINDLVSLEDGITIILDDYHLITEPEIHDSLAFFIENQPPQVQLVIATRVDPALPLARLRVDGQLGELRAENLCFSFAEAAEFFNQCMGLQISDRQISALLDRTEGWVAGLQLAALTIRGDEDPEDLINDFTGSHRFVLEYLVEEVLEQQPEAVREFLLQTSILGQLTAPLCNSVTGFDNGQDMLETLEHSNLFLIPLDNERCCYRYHHLLADFLQQRLTFSNPGRLSSLHISASEWYEQNGMADEAIDHAFQAEDYQRAAGLIDQAAEAVWARGEHAKLRQWIEKLPQELVRDKPDLCIFRAWDLFASGHQEQAGKYLQAAYSDDDPGEDSDRQQLNIRGKAEVIQAWMAAYRTAVPEIIKHSHLALQYLSEDDLNWRCAAAITLGDAYCINGDYLSAYPARLDAMSAAEAAGNNYLYLNSSVRMAITLRALGKLAEVVDLCDKRMQLAEEKGIQKSAVAGWLLAIWGETLAETGESDRALEYTREAVTLTEGGSDMVMLGWSYVSMIRALFSRGDLPAMQEVIHKMEDRSQELTMPRFLVNLNRAWQPRAWLAADQSEKALQWLQDLETGNSPDFVEGFLSLSQARILITEGKWEESIDLLRFMLSQAEQCGNKTRMIEVLLLLCLAYQAAREPDQAVAYLLQALRLAEPLGYSQSFVDEGPQMAQLLFLALEGGHLPDFIQKLLAAFPHGEANGEELSLIKADDGTYIEALTEREIQILELIATGLTNAEIAERLFITTNTVKTHTRNIFAKIKARNRTEAVSRAKTLGFINPN